MNKIILKLEITLDGDASNRYVQELIENVANALQHEANEVGLSPDDGPCIERLRVEALSDPVSGEHFKVVPVERHIV